MFYVDGDAYRTSCSLYGAQGTQAYRPIIVDVTNNVTGESARIQTPALFMCLVKHDTCNRRTLCEVRV